MDRKRAGGFKQIREYSNESRLEEVAREASSRNIPEVISNKVKQINGSLERLNSTESLNSREEISEKPVRKSVEETLDGTKKLKKLKSKDFYEILDNLNS